MINDFYNSIGSMSSSKKKIMRKETTQDTLSDKFGIKKLILPLKKLSLFSRNDNRSGLSTRRIRNISCKNSSSHMNLPLIKSKSYSGSSIIDNESHQKRKRCLQFAGKIKLKKYIRNRILNKNSPTEDVHDSSSEIKKMYIDDKMELFKTHLEVVNQNKDTTSVSKKHSVKVTGGKVNLEDLAYGAKITYRARQVEKNGQVYYEFDTAVGDEEEDKITIESNRKNNNKIMELIRKYREKELYNLKIGQLGRGTQMKMRSSVFKDQTINKIYQNLLHMMMPSIKQSHL